MDFVLTASSLGRLNQEEADARTRTEFTNENTETLKAHMESFANIENDRRVEDAREFCSFLRKFQSIPHEIISLTINMDCLVDMFCRSRQGGLPTREAIEILTQLCILDKECLRQKDITEIAEELDLLFSEYREQKRRIWAPFLPFMKQLLSVPLFRGYHIPQGTYTVPYMVRMVEQVVSIAYNEPIENQMNYIEIVKALIRGEVGNDEWLSELLDNLINFLEWQLYTDGMLLTLSGHISIWLSLFTEWSLYQNKALLEPYIDRLIPLMRYGLGCEEVLCDAVLFCSHWRFPDEILPEWPAMIMHDDVIVQQFTAFSITNTLLKNPAIVELLPTFGPWVDFVTRNMLQFTYPVKKQFLMCLFMMGCRDRDISMLLYQAGGLMLMNDMLESSDGDYELVFFTVMYVNHMHVVFGLNDELHESQIIETINAYLDTEDVQEELEKMVELHAEIQKFRSLF